MLQLVGIFQLSVSENPTEIGLRKTVELLLLVTEQSQGNPQAGFAANEVICFVCVVVCPLFSSLFLPSF